MKRSYKASDSKQSSYKDYNTKQTDVL